MKHNFTLDMGYCPVCRAITQFRKMCTIHYYDEEKVDIWVYCFKCGNRLMGQMKECSKCQQKYNVKE